MRALVWAGVAVALVLPLAVAATSPLLQWRSPVYIAAGFAGVLGLAVIFMQPLLAAGALPGLPAWRGRRVHQWTGAALVALVVAHVVGLWVTSPPDVVDALLLRSPTPFSPWGVLSMWAIFAAGVLALLRNRLRPRGWRRAHVVLTSVIVASTVTHALLIEGTMGAVSKWALCIAVVAVTLKAFSDLRVWRLMKPRR
ncbi:ferric reductase-like transmembrane domain-containing protein [Lutimaribacter sp. EGI FJ00015]|uniref:Ferric reductase-like transmembrane domain-containing protein n=1 Tax=Lutimaribacter degradans TaxID=2945989 RepID=A0ACC5ZW26_9RHOB|nr:ferric reductase-like transmembrane domain-containing protein [Lutimaribacter sp. EGI FJ00013]MCM2562537.1 ferric reductase-like transmembrane domain-containing protein [Lutimaribacter sp. EGI FJ00013]MCO0613694.1 ferric reductase-like transmembrane domain-containing protein [Lutimaribacter sp. EGI FJ00015]MCO0636823.1 ferric reductase-like transmembrane domain-containing protein [Lutimaribacter sp. EGI FJ00014]